MAERFGVDQPSCFTLAALCLFHAADTDKTRFQ